MPADSLLPPDPSHAGLGQHACICCRVTDHCSSPDIKQFPEMESFFLDAANTCQLMGKPAQVGSHPNMSTV